MGQVDSLTGGVGSAGHRCLEHGGTLQHLSLDHHLTGEVGAAPLIASLDQINCLLVLEPHLILYPLRSQFQVFHLLFQFLQVNLLLTDDALVRVTKAFKELVLVPQPTHLLVNIEACF